METGFGGKVTSAADGSPAGRVVVGDETVEIHAGDAVLMRIAATKMHARPGTRSTPASGSVSQQVGMFAGRQTRYVAPCRDNKDATFHRRHIAFAGKKRIGNDSTTTGTDRFDATPQW
jgi:hypothetical protein